MSPDICGKFEIKTLATYLLCVSDIFVQEILKFSWIYCKRSSLAVVSVDSSFPPYPLELTIIDEELKELPFVNNFVDGVVEMVLELWL